MPGKLRIHGRLPHCSLFEGWWQVSKQRAANAAVDLIMESLSVERRAKFRRVAGSRHRQARDRCEGQSRDFRMAPADRWVRDSVRRHDRRSIGRACHRSAIELRACSACARRLSGASAARQTEPFEQAVQLVERPEAQGNFPFLAAPRALSHANLHRGSKNIGKGGFDALQIARLVVPTSE